MSSSWIMVINCRYQRYAVFVRWALRNETPFGVNARKSNIVDWIVIR